MDILSRIGIWLNRLLLFAVSVLFTLIAFKYLLHPAENAGEVNILLSSPAATTVARVGFGAFPLGIAVVVFSSIFSLNRLYTGIYVLTIMISIITAVRVIGLIVDGSTQFNLTVLRPETAIMALSFIGIFLELRRRRMYERKSD
jgi:hypothetical protein